jgi:hypothetical protein
VVVDLVVDPVVVDPVVVNSVTLRPVVLAGFPFRPVGFLVRPVG